MKKKRTLLLFLIGITMIFTATTMIHAQEIVLSDLLAIDVNSRWNDAEEEMTSGLLTLYFFNALNGEPLSGANVELDGVGIYTTDYQGKINFLPQEDDYQQHVIFRKNGFITSQFEIEILVGTIFFNRFSVSPVMDINKFRIVLDWDKSPLDLDSHFLKQNEYHLSYRDMRTLKDNTGQLDIDDTDGYGPETITVDQIKQNGSYSFFVHDYSNRNNANSNALAKSKATVKVYGEGQLLKVYKIPQNKKGRTWKVFSISNGSIIDDNQFE